MDEHISRFNADTDDPSHLPDHGVRPGFSLLLQSFLTSLLDLPDLADDKAQPRHIALQLGQYISRSGVPSGVCTVARRSAALRRVGLKLRTPSRASVAFIRLTMRVRFPTRHSRSRFGRLASSSAIVGTRAMLQWPRSPPVKCAGGAAILTTEWLYRLPVIPRCGRVNRQAYHVWGVEMSAYFFRSEPGAAELRRLARRESGRVCQRVLMIANLLEGMEHEEAARLAGLSRSAAYEWHNRYEEDGIAGLRDRPRPGRQPRVDAITSARFKERIVAGAALERDGVVAFRGVDAQRILKEEFDIDCSLSSTYRLLHRMKLSWLAPRPRHPESDATAQAEFPQLLDCN